jgi:hypothetical protein
MVDFSFGFFGGRDRSTNELTVGVLPPLAERGHYVIESQERNRDVRPARIASY